MIRDDVKTVFKAFCTMIVLFGMICVFEIKLFVVKIRTYDVSLD